MLLWGGWLGDWIGGWRGRHVVRLVCRTDGRKRDADSSATREGKRQITGHKKKKKHFHGKRKVWYGRRMETRERRPAVIGAERVLAHDQGVTR
ncbi:unnamed protein product [Boreogadus saida]